MVYSTVEHCSAKNEWHEISQAIFDTFDHSQHLIHKIFFFFFASESHFTFLKIKIICLKSLFPSISNNRLNKEKYNNLRIFLNGY